MGISVIIIHFAPKDTYLEVLKRTIRSIRTQAFDGDVEILVADDGSLWSQCLLETGEEFKACDSTAIGAQPLLADLSVDHYLLARTSERYNKAKLWNRAAGIAKHDKLVFLDDDHPFADPKSLARYSELLDRYNFVIGRIRNPDGTFRTYSHRTVQGANFAMQSRLLEAVGGFGEYTSEWGRGEDSDIFWKVYRLWKESSGQQVQAYYAGNIVTEDVCSRRWEGCAGNEAMFIEGFRKMHGVMPHDNPSRHKRDWVEVSWADKLSDPFWRLKNLFFRTLQCKSKR